MMSRVQRRANKRADLRVWCICVIAGTCHVSFFSLPPAADWCAASSELPRNTRLRSNQKKKKKKRKEEDNLQLRDYTSLTSCTARSQLTGSLSPGASKSLECVYFRATCAELSFVFDSGIFKLWHRQVLNGIEVPVLMGHPVRNELSAHVCAAWQVQMSWLTFPSGWGCWARHWIYN